MGSSVDRSSNKNEISKGRHSDEQTVAPLLFLCEKGLEPPKMALAVPFE